MTSNQLKRAVKAAEKARNEWDGMGEIPVTYEALCELRAKLTIALMEADATASQVRREAEADARMWDGIWARLEARA